MVLDTGAPWNVLQPELVEVMECAPERLDMPRRLLIRGIWYDGQLARAQYSLIAMVGSPLVIEGLFFIPDAGQQGLESLPNFLGYRGCIERCIIAIDPAEGVVCFGEA